MNQDPSRFDHIKAVIAPAREFNEHPSATERIKELEDRNQLLEKLLHESDIRRREGRALLHRMTKYVTEDGAVTHGSTRLARLADAVKQYLVRSNNPCDVLRVGVDLSKDESRSVSVYIVPADPAEVVAELRKRGLEAQFEDFVDPVEVLAFENAADLVAEKLGVTP